MQAYLAKAGDEVVKGGHLNALLGVFQKLIASKAHDHEGFEVLCALVENLPLAVYESALPTVFTLLFSRLQTSRTTKFVRGFITFLAVFIVKHSPAVVAGAMDTVQPGIFMMLVQQVWLPNMGLVDGTDEEKVVLVASTKCLCEFPAMQQSTEVWTQLRDATVKHVEGKSDGGGAGGGDCDEGFDEEMQGYSAAYAKLANASKTERPVLAEITDPKQYLEASLARMGAR
jgi:exportin-2 (importin alpha re-exporter)